MKKALNITLAGLIFNIEEDAYTELKNYLDSVKNHFASETDKEEIINDIESSIAEKFQAKIKPTKQAVTLNDVLELIKVMGTVADFENEEQKKEEEISKTGIKKTKRLYRDCDNAIIAGVCSGLAAYFGVDPVIFRLIFGLSVFFGGSGILVYLILWVAIPCAKTSSQKLEMHGDPVTLSKLEQKVKDKINEEKISGTFTRVARIPLRVGEGLIKLLKNILPALGILFGIVLTVAALAAILGFTLAFAVLFSRSGLNFYAAEFLDILSLPNANLLITATYFTVLIPVIFILLLGIRLLSKRKIFTAGLTSLLCAMWFIAIIVSVVLAIDFAPKVENYLNNISWNEARTFSGLKDFSKISTAYPVNIQVSKGSDYTVNFVGSKAQLNRIKTEVKGKRLSIEIKWPNLCFLCQVKPIKAYITMPQINELSLSGSSKAELSEGFDAEEFLLVQSGASQSIIKINSPVVKTDFSGASRATLSGQGKSLLAEISGASKIYAVDFPVDSALVKLSGASRAEIFAKEKITLEASGASRLNYKGEPQIFPQLSGGSRVEKISEKDRVISSNEVIEMDCLKNDDCPQAWDYAVLSSCPYQSVCLDNSCAIACPVGEYRSDISQSAGNKAGCQNDTDCNCENRVNEFISCKCVDNLCLAIVKK
ncbi:PspC domain-containing protein [Candidatus Parcubacteria bacterium]|nr:MAG: PspC domain-containing protein [Candidatus Parcubacteria bacterium]